MAREAELVAAASVPVVAAVGVAGVISSEAREKDEELEGLRWVGVLGGRARGEA